MSSKRSRGRRRKQRETSRRFLVWDWVYLSRQGERALARSPWLRRAITIWAEVVRVGAGWVDVKHSPFSASTVRIPRDWVVVVARVRPTARLQRKARR